MSEDTNKQDSIVEESSENKPESFTVSVFDTIKHEEVEVEVSEEEFYEYRRGKWRIEKTIRKTIVLTNTYM